MPEPMFVANAVPKDTLFHLGVLAVECAAADYFLGLLHAKLTGGAGPVPDVMARDTRWKSERCLELATDTGLKAALKLVPDILADRNFFLHALVTSTQPDGPVDTGMAFRGKYGGTSPFYTEEGIKALIERVGGLNGFLVAHSGL